MSEFRWSYAVNAVLYAATGIGVLALAMFLLERATHFWRGVVEEKNVALGIFIGAVAIAVGLIVASAVH